MNTHKAEPLEMEGQFRSLSDGSTTFEGYAAIFNQTSKPIRDDLSRLPYTETILPSSFKRSLGSGRHIKFVVDHDDRKMISSMPNGPLRLAEDSRGLHVTSPWPRTDYADNVRALHDAGERLGMSIFFATPRNGDKWETPSRRSVSEAILYHTSVLATFEPAYEGTIATFRALAELTETDVEDVDALMEALRAGRRLEEGEFNLLNKLAEAVKPEAVESATPVVEPETEADMAGTEKRRALLEAIEATLPKS